MKTTAKELFNKILDFKNIDECCRDDRYILSFGMVYLINEKYYEVVQDEYQYWFMPVESDKTYAELKEEGLSFYLDREDEIELANGKVITSDFTFHIFTFLDVNKLF